MGDTDVTVRNLTMTRLEDIKRFTSEGVEFWLARDLHSILGYDVWDKFAPVIARARDAFDNSGTDPSHHIAHTSKLMAIGKGAQRSGDDYFLSRAACYLIAMNGESSKTEIAAAQAYFAIQTRRVEIADQRAADLKRLETRERVTIAAKRVNAVAKEFGVEHFALFHDARYRGLYNMSLKELANLKRLPTGESILDRAAALELTANAFQMELASERITRQGTRGEAVAIKTNEEVARGVRQAMIDQIGHGPESLALEPEPIKTVKARVVGRSRPKTLK